MQEAQYEPYQQTASCPGLKAGWFLETYCLTQSRGPGTVAKVLSRVEHIAWVPLLGLRWGVTVVHTHATFTTRTT